MVVFSDKYRLEDRIEKIDVKMLTSEEEKLCMQPIAELKERRLLLSKLRDMQEVLVSQGDEGGTRGQTIAVD